MMDAALALCRGSSARSGAMLSQALLQTIADSVGVPSEHSEDANVPWPPPKLRQAAQECRREEL